MIAGAVQRYLQSRGYSPVRILGGGQGLGDYVPGAGPVWGVWSEERADSERIGQRMRELYRAGLMVRCRDDNTPMAIENVRRTVSDIMAMLGQTVAYTLPDGTVRQYEVTGVRRTNGPADYPTPGGGYEATSNYDLMIREASE